MGEPLVESVFHYRLLDVPISVVRIEIAIFLLLIDLFLTIGLHLNRSIWVFTFLSLDIMAFLDPLRILFDRCLLYLLAIFNHWGLLREHFGVSDSWIELWLICICVYLVCLYFHFERHLRRSKVLFWLKLFGHNLVHWNSVCYIVVVWWFVLILILIREVTLSV